jgi:hypothetical protein
MENVWNTWLAKSTHVCPVLRNEYFERFKSAKSVESKGGEAIQKRRDQEIWNRVANSARSVNQPTKLE